MKIGTLESKSIVMKKINLLLCILLAFAGECFAQDAQWYFGKGLEYLDAGNYSQARTYFLKADELVDGDTACQLNVGLCYNMEGNHSPAVYWIRKSAEQGYDLAQLSLGSMYYDGEGVAKDDSQAVYWWRKAAEQGNAKAQCNLGVMYYNGNGVSKDDSQAVYWWRKSAEQGNADAQSRLAAAYIMGYGVDEDLEQAEYWARKAAAQGNENAKEILSLME